MCRVGGVLCFGLWIVGCWGSGIVGGALLAAARCRWLALAGMGGGAAGGGRSAADRGSAAGRGRCDPPAVLIGRALAVRPSRRPHRAGAGGLLPAPRPSAAGPGVKPGQKEKDQSGRRGVCAACSGLSASPGAGPGVVATRCRWRAVPAAGRRWRLHCSGWRCSSVNGFSAG